MLEFEDGPRREPCPPRSAGARRHEFYDFEAKYIDSARPASCPADLTDEATAEVRRLAVEAFEALSCEGLARVDFFLARTTASS